MDAGGTYKQKTEELFLACSFSLYIDKKAERAQNYVYSTYHFSLEFSIKSIQSKRFSIKLKHTWSKYITWLPGIGYCFQVISTIWQLFIGHLAHLDLLELHWIFLG